jgi:hypothetical protein
MLITPRGEPVPPQEAVRRLREIDERLSVKWVPSASGPYWGIIETWKQGDERWARVNSGEIREEQAFDLRAMLPPDCSAEEAVGFVERFFEPVTDPAKQAAAKMERVDRENKAVKAAHMERFMEEQELKTATTSKHEYEVQLGVAEAHPISHGFGEGTTEGAQVVARRKRIVRRTSEV